MGRAWAGSRALKVIWADPAPRGLEHPLDQLGHHAVHVGDRSHHPGQAAVVVLANEGLGEQLLVEMEDQVGG
jgi:hypothetical protein